MQTYEEALQARSGCDDETIPCANCGHLDFEHDPESLRCTVTEIEPDRRKCTCLRFEPLDIDDLSDAEGILDE